MSPGEMHQVEQILQALSRYEQRLKGQYDPVRQAGSLANPPVTQAMQHILWMIGETQQHAERGHLDKAWRWLCFIQGVAWALGWGPFSTGPTIDDFRADNRGKG